MFKTDRRGFLVGCSAAIAGMAGSRLGFAAFGGSAQRVDNNVLIYVFLRGGMDGLSLVPPVEGPDRGLYEAARPRLQIPADGAAAALALDDGFGLHSAAAPLHEIYQEGRLAIIHAVGLTYNTRSHFDAMEFIELGTPGNRSKPTGWLTRHLDSADSPVEALVAPSMSLTGIQPTSLLGDRRTLALEDPGDFSLNTGHWRWRDAQRLALRRLYDSRKSSVHDSGFQALKALDIVEAHLNDDYEPSNGAEYPNNGFGRRLRNLAQMIKLRLGLSVATIDLGGWDTHNRQGIQPQGYFGRLISTLSQGLSALYTDLDEGGFDNFNRNVTVVVQSEFGRRLRENADQGTDHGSANAMLVMGGSVNGGLYGEWPGLDFDQLYDGADLAVTTDYRRVLSEILIRRQANPRLGQIFPGYTDYSPLGVVEGPDLSPDYSTQDRPDQGPVEIQFRGK